MERRDETVLSRRKLSSIVLGKMKEVAETQLTEKVADAVVTVPAFFNDGQRQAAKDSGVIAGLNVLRIINEQQRPLHLVLMKNTKKEHHVLILDLGGEVFDSRLVNYFVSCIKNTWYSNGTC